MKRRVDTPANTERRNSSPFLIFLLGFITILLFGSVGVAVLLPYINSLPFYVTKSISFSVFNITEDTQLDYKNRLIINSDTVLGTVMVYSTDTNVAFTNVEPKYVFGDEGGDYSNVRISFSLMGYEYNSVSFSLETCNSVGENQKVVDKKDISVVEVGKSEFLATYRSLYNIYIKSLTVSYSLRVK